jgi:N-acetylmuramoyl-L-alanine amidase
MKKLLPPWLSRCRALAGGLTLALLTGCATAPPPAPAPINVPFTTPGGIPIDVSVTARGQDSRVLFLILHYTVLDLPNSIRVLTQNEVSSHYLLTDHASPHIMRLVDEYQRAWHAGPSSWRGNRQLNASSIGIEIVHPGARTLPNGEREYLPFPPEQINALIPLVQDIVRRHQIRPERILGHNEIQPQTKQDPGPTFPWKRFADLGITPPWPDAARVAAQRAVFEATPPDIAWWQKALVQHGYELAQSGQFDTATKNVLASFQMRYRPTNYAGQADAETAAFLHVLTTPLTPAMPAPAPVAPAMPNAVGSPN